MAFGRDTDSSTRRAERFRAFVHARSPFALIGACFGLLAVVDAITGVLGVVFGLTAIVLGSKGLADLSKRPHLVGRRLAVAAIVMGSIGLVVGAALWATRWFAA
jgi:hypothetical protein